MGGEEAGFHPDAAKGSGTLYEIKPSLSCTDSIKQVSLFNSQAKGREQSLLVCRVFFKQSTQEQVCEKLCFCRLWVFLLSARLSCSVALLLCVLLHWRLINASPEGGKGEIAKDSSAVGYLHLHEKQKPLWLQKRRNVPWLYAGRKAIRWETNSQLPTPFSTSAEKNQFLGTMGRSTQPPVLKNQAGVCLSRSISYDR